MKLSFNSNDYSDVTYESFVNYLKTLESMFDNLYEVRITFETKDDHDIEECKRAMSSLDNNDKRTKDFLDRISKNNMDFNRK